MILGLSDLAVPMGDMISYRLGYLFILETGPGSIIVIDSVKKEIRFNAYSYTDEAFIHSMSDVDRYKVLADYNLVDTVSKIIKYRNIYENPN